MHDIRFFPPRGQSSRKAIVRRLTNQEAHYSIVDNTSQSQRGKRLFWRVKTVRVGQGKRDRETTADRGKQKILTCFKAYLNQLPEWHEKGN